MLRHESEIIGYAIQASDGAIGTVSDVFFDDATWLVRWLVVDTGNWLPGRKVLLPPSALAEVNHIGHQFSVNLTKEQVNACPEADSDRPVSRQMESEIYGHYGWSPYWGDGTYAGLDGAMGGVFIGPALLSPELLAEAKVLEDARHAKDDPALRSANEVIGYQILASDGEIGHVDDFLFEDEDWSVHYMVIDTKNWWAGKKVLISPMSVRRIEWQERRVSLGANRLQVQHSPAYDPAMTIDPIYEKNYEKYYTDLG
jgi:sporulation protein YlmC with PRC-barrel domain